MAESRLHQLTSSARASGSTTSPATCSERRARADDARGRRRRRHVQPDDLPEGDRRGDAYDEQLRELLEDEADPRRSSSQLAVAATSGRPATSCAACGTSGAGQDGYVSIEVDPGLAYDTRRHPRRPCACTSGRPPEPLVKIPATRPGLAAIEEMIARGPLDQRHADLLARAPRGGRRGVHPRARAARRGGRRSREGRARSRASSSRASTPRPTSGSRRSAAARRAARASSRSRTRSSRTSSYKEIFAGERWEALAAKGATQQRCLWASTSTKNPAYRDVMYVEELIGPETVNTMPQETIEAFQDHGEVARTLERGIEEARQVFDGSRCGGRRLRRRRRTRSSVRAWRSSPTRSRSCSRASRQARRARSGVTTTPGPSSSSGSGRATRRSGPGATRQLARLARRAGADARARRRARRVRDGGAGATRRRRPARAWAARALRPRSCGGRSRSSASTCSTRRTRPRSGALEPTARPRADALRLASKSGSTLETRSPPDYFWERAGEHGGAFVAVTDPGSSLEQLARRARLRAVFTASRRSAAATRRCRRSGSCRPC